MNCDVIGTGSYLPKNILTNDALAQRYHLDTSDTWIRERTGISQRHIVGEDENTATMATMAARYACEKAGVSFDALDMIICATTTPVYTFPSVAVMVQSALGCRRIPAFDVQAVCAGFSYALMLAYTTLKTDLARTILVIGADTMSSLLDWHDRRTCVLFGDGAGAVILRAHANTSEKSGILGVNAYADGTQVENLYTSGGPASHTGTCGTIVMRGLEVFRYAIDAMSQSINDLAAQLNIPLSSVDWFIPHQANARILAAIGKKLAIDPRKIVSTIAQHANTSAASIPLALDVHAPSIQKGQIVMLTSMGAGFTWGSVLIKW